MVVSGQFASNVKLLTDPSVYCYSTKFMPATGFIIFTGFNCILLLLVIDAHGTNFVRGDGSHPKVVRDAPWTSHWPKVLFMWLPLLGAPPPHAATRRHGGRLSLFGGHALLPAPAAGV